MDSLAQEHEANLLLREEFSSIFSCSFSLRLFPFSAHPCTFSLKLSYKGTSTPIFHKQGVQVFFSSHSITTFTATSARYKLLPDAFPRTLLITVLLESQYGAFVLTTFMPCYIIGIIGTLTISFHSRNFSDRIMVTISCLIVIATLFSQLNTTMPTSAEPKAVDIFFFYFITRLFLVGIHHTFLYLRTYRADAKKQIELHGYNQPLLSNDGQSVFDDCSDDEEYDNCVPVEGGSAKLKTGGSVAITKSWFDPKKQKKSLASIMPKVGCTFEFVFCDVNVGLYLTLIDFIFMSSYTVYIFQGRIEIQKYFWTH